MDREFQIKFCSVCVNRQISKDSGIICSITNNQADFEDNCETFYRDEIESKRVMIEKIHKYGLTEKAGPLNNLLGKVNEYEITKLTRLIKPNCENELPSSTYVGKSHLKYGFGISAIIFLMVYGLINTEFEGFDLTIVGINLALVGAIIWVVVDYKSNKNDFTINENGIIRSGKLIPWKIILGTLIRKVPSNSFSEYHLILIVGTKDDIEINLTGLEGHFDRIGNLVELYKERHEKLHS